MEQNNMIEQLEQIVEKLESGQCGMDESTRLFAEGTEIAKALGKQIEETKGKISVVKQQLDKIIEEDFE
ncbi:MAG: exodeoxyribonuclease VII small subunit [Clostridia bacterium]|nr:exodeoxyribonuclease VII small subunit [Clostridia bacterium]